MCKLFAFVTAALMSDGAAAQVALPNGRCVAFFEPTVCGVITIENGLPTRYQSGDCSADGRITNTAYQTVPTVYRSVIHIGAATFLIREVLGTSMIGTWSYRDYSATKIFQC